jgi:hypothetical protein
LEEDLSGASSFSDVDLNAPQSEFGKYLDQICPYYMSCGMTWDEFWNESIDRLQAYWQSNQFSIERRNQELWLQGMYIYEAIADLSPVLHAFAKKGTKPQPYTDTPYPITKKQRERIKAEKERQMFEKGKRFMETLLQQTNEKFKEVK